MNDPGDAPLEPVARQAANALLSPAPAQVPDAAEKTHPASSSLRDAWLFFRQFGVFLRPYWGRLAVGEFFGLVFAGLNGLLPLLLQTVLAFTLPEAHSPERTLGSHQFTKLLKHLPSLGPDWTVLLACSAIPAVMILRSLFDFLNTYYLAWVSLRVLSDIRGKAYSHILSQSLDFFHEQRAGLLISRVTNDTRVAQSALELIGVDLIKQPVTIFAGVGTLLYLDSRFTFFALVLFPACIIPVAVYGKRIRRASRRDEEQSGAMTVILQETFAGIRVIKSFAREGYQNGLFRRLSLEQFSNSMRIRKAAEIVGPLVEVIAAAGVALALFYAHTAGLSYSKLFALIAGMFLLYNPAKSLSKLHLQAARLQAATGSLFDLMKLRPTIVDAAGAIILKARCRGAVSFREVSFSYHGPDGLPALAEISLDILPGRYYALVGASGAGKSTFFALLQRFYDPQLGAITLDDADLRQLEQQSLRTQISLVSQDTFLFHDTIANNIRYGNLEASDAEVAAAARTANADDFVRALPQGYQTIVGDKGCRLSGGQQQRVAIARAVLKNAPILLLDEATSALDSESERAVQTALETLAAGRTVIAIAHRLSTILAADEIIVLDAGRVVQSGRHGELLEQAGGLYRRLYDLQFEHVDRGGG